MGMEPRGEGHTGPATEGGLVVSRILLTRPTAPEEVDQKHGATKEQAQKQDG